MGYSPTDLAWAAGFLDGEGCFQLRKLSKTKKNWGPQLEAAQTCSAPLRKLRVLFGGRVQLLPRKTRGNRRVWRWDLNGALAIRSALNSMLPFLIVKKKQAALVLAYVNRMRVGIRGGGHLSDLERTRREKIVNKLLKERAGYGR